MKATSPEQAERRMTAFLEDYFSPRNKPVKVFGLKVVRLPTLNALKEVFCTKFRSDQWLRFYAAVYLLTKQPKRCGFMWLKKDGHVRLHLRRPGMKPPPKKALPMLFVDTAEGWQPEDSLLNAAVIMLKVPCPLKSGSLQQEQIRDETREWLRGHGTSIRATVKQLKGVSQKSLMGRVARAKAIRFQEKADRLESDFHHLNATALTDVRAAFEAGCIYTQIEHMADAMDSGVADKKQRAGRKKKTPKISKDLERGWFSAVRDTGSRPTLSCVLEKVAVKTENKGGAKDTRLRLRCGLWVERTYVAKEIRRIAGEHPEITSKGQVAKGRPRKDG